MKIIVTHTSPDWDAIGGVWILKKYLPGWQDAIVEFVPAGLRSEKVKNVKDISETDPIIAVGKDEIIHVDTGLLPLDHHQTSDRNVCGASRAWEYVQQEAKKSGVELTTEHKEAGDRIIKVITEIDHFRECFWADPTADYQEFSLIGVLDGLKLLYPDQDEKYVEFGREALDALMHQFENRIWAEREIADKGVIFDLKHGRGIAFETINDSVLKLSQKMGFMVVVRKDPRKGYVRIKVRPENDNEESLDLTLAYEQLKKIDPDATWFLHVSKKMLLNGTPKNPKMIPTSLSLEKIVNVLTSIY